MLQLWHARGCAPITLAFSLLGAQTGLRAVCISDIYIRFSLTPGQLGVISTVSVVAGVLALLAGSRLTDAFGRRMVLVLGLVGTGLSYLLNANADDYNSLLATWALYGLACSFIDLGANTIAADFDRHFGTSTMSHFHANFSAGAAVGAFATAWMLHADLTFRPIFAAMGATLIGATIIFCMAKLPPHLSIAVLNDGNRSDERMAHSRTVVLAAAIVFCCFFGDGILETFLSTYVRTGSSALVAGLAVAGFHAASWVGRLVSGRLIHQYGERRVLMASAAVASVAIVGAIIVREPWVVVMVLAVVGFALAPIVPIGFALAGRAAPHSTGKAIGFTTAIGYIAFIASPVAAGALADTASLSWGIGLSALSVVFVALLAARLPKPPAELPTH